MVDQFMDASRERCQGGAESHRISSPGAVMCNVVTSIGVYACACKALVKPSTSLWLRKFRTYRTEKLGRLCDVGTQGITFSNGDVRGLVVASSRSSLVHRTLFPNWD